MRENNVSIPQAVSTVATIPYANYLWDTMPRVSIPQAVSTVATINPDENNVYEVARFNTASGKHCCNVNTPNYVPGITKVSIPQAVSTVATLQYSV